MDSVATAHMVMDDTVLSENKNLSNESTGSAKGKVLRANSAGTSKFSCPWGTGPVSLEQALHVPLFAHCLASVAALWDN